MQNALVISGGAWQVPLIAFLKEKGHHVSVVDPYDYSPGVAIADAHIKADVRDQIVIEEQIEQLNTEFSFVCTDQSDVAVETANNIASKLGLPCNPQAAVRRFVNKYETRTFGSAIGMQAPQWRKVSNVDEVVQVVKDIGLPLILKPPDNQASCGINRLDNENLNDVGRLFSESLMHSRTGYLLCEEYVSGIGITMEGICSGGKHKSVAVSAKDHFPSGVIASLLYPTTVPEDLLTEIFRANDTFVEASGLQFGITHAEYIVDVPGNRFWLVEIACRGGGTLVASTIAQWVSGIDLYEIFYKDLRGSSSPVKDLVPGRNAALLQFLEFGEGKVRTLKGLERVKDQPGVYQIKLAFKPGDTIKRAKDGRTRQGFYIIFGTTHADVLSKSELVHQTLKVQFDQQVNFSAAPMHVVTI